LCEYSFCWSEEEGFQIPETWEKVSENAFVCMLRRDYLENNKGPLRGKELEKTVRIFLDQAKKYFGKAMGDPNCESFIVEKLTELVEGT
jgi:hypothetical protein